MKPRYRVISTEHKARMGDVFKAVNGMWYKTAPYRGYPASTCSGCAFAESHIMCHAAPKCTGIIFKEMK